MFVWNAWGARRFWRCGAAATALAAAGTAAYAQDGQGGGDEGERDVIVVTGTRASIQRAQNIKKSSSSIVDALTAADIGEFIDSDLSDALERIPSLLVERDDESGTAYAIRGLGGSFTKTLFNGRTVETGFNRNFDLRTIDSNMVGRVIVYKSPEARRDGGAVGGTASIEAVDPLNLRAYGRNNDDVILLQARANYDESAEEASPFVSGFASKRFTDSFGLAGAVSYQETASFSNIIDAPQLNAGNNLFGPQDGASPAGRNAVIPPGTIRNRLLRARDRERTEERFNISAIASWKPTENLSIAGDIYYSNYQRLLDDNERFFLIQSFRNGNSAAGSYIENAQLSDDDLYLAAGDYTIAPGFNGNFSRIGSIYNFAETDQLIGGVKFAWENETWTLFGDVSVVRTEQTASFNEFSYFVRNVGSVVSFDGTGEEYGISFSDTTFDDAAYLFSGYNLNRGINQNDEDAYQLDVTRRFNEVSWLDAIHAGAKLRDHRVDDYTNVFRRLNANALVATGLVDAATLNDPTPFFTGLANPSELLPGRFSIDPFLALDGDAIFAAYGAAAEAAAGRPLDFSMPGVGSLGTNQPRYLDEKITAAYIQADFFFPVFQRPFSGNIGVRWERTKTDALGVALPNAPGDDLREFEEEGEYENVLPSLNLSYRPTDTIYLRFAASRAIARPNLRDLDPTTVFGNPETGDDFNPGDVETQRQARRGNPDLDPFEVDQWDITAEWYPDLRGAPSLAVAYFNKSVSAFVDRRLVNEVFPAYPELGVIQISETFTNGEGAKISGIEITGHIPASAFIEEGAALSFLDGFGVRGTFTKLFDQETTTVDAFTGQNQTLPGTSEWSYSLLGYYRRGPFRANVSYARRDDFVQSQVNATLNNAILTVEGTERLNATVSYDISKRIQLRLAGANLTEDPTERYFSTPGLFNTYRTRGREWSIGVRAKL